jgi:hypothetical protein
MMHRLRDLSSSSDPLAARAAALLSSMPALDAEGMQRRAPWAIHTQTRRLTGRVRVAFGLATTMASLGAAAATLHGVFPLAEPRTSPAVASAPMAPPVSATAPAAHGIAVVSVQSLPQVAAEGGPARDVAPSSPFAPRALSGWTRASRELPRQAVSGGSRAGESTLIVEAVRALRRDADPVRAQSLAEESLRRYPQGAQVEEAMALAMEAASARGDAAGAQRSAERYLGSYRSGRFADRARRILSVNGSR